MNGVLLPIKIESVGIFSSLVCPIYEEGGSFCDFPRINKPGMVLARPRKKQETHFSVISLFTRLFDLAVGVLQGSLLFPLNTR